MRRTVMGLPFIVSNMVMKSPFCSGRRAARAASRSSSEAARDEVLDELLALSQEHVLGAAQPHALGAAVDGVAGVVRGVGVGAHLEAAHLVRVAHKTVHGGDELAGVDVAATSRASARPRRR